MRIQLGDQILGIPVLTMRKLLKYVQGLQSGTLDIIVQQLEVDAATARQIQQGLLDEGYIEPSGPLFGQGHWQLTWQGSALANASTRKPITRKTAERLVEEFLSRVREINAGDYAYRVRRVIVFGSFLSDTPDLGDIDLSIELEDRSTDPDERQAAHQASIALAEQAGRTFKDYMEMLGWSEREVILKLKNRSPSLSLHYEWREQVLTRPIPSKILFDAALQEEPGGRPTWNK